MPHPNLFIQVLDNVGAVTALLANCTPATMFRIGRTCRFGYKVVKAYVKHTYNIKRHLKHFFTDPDEFRALQARTNFVISGSNALQFMDRTFYPESDLDLYVGFRHKRELGMYIMEKGGKGYVFRPNSRQAANFKVACDRRVIIYQQQPDANNAVDEFHWDAYELNGIAEVYTFESTDEDRAKPLKIQIIVADRTPLDCILSFHSTVVMNAITYRAAYSLYPHGTFEENRSLVCTGSARQEPALAKYRARGWVEQREVDQSEEEDPKAPFHFGKRWVDDDMSWVLPLDHDAPPTTQYTMSSKATFDPFSVQGWSLVRDGNLAMTRYSILLPLAFEHLYTAQDDFMEMLRPWMSAQGVLQRERDRPEARFDSTLPGWRDTYTRNCQCKDCSRLCRKRPLPNFAFWYKV